MNVVIVVVIVMGMMLWMGGFIEFDGGVFVDLYVLESECGSKRVEVVILFKI